MSCSHLLVLNRVSYVHECMTTLGSLKITKLSDTSNVVRDCNLIRDDVPLV